eukprot:7819404-Alexandrium_andersonii.AAC.1
MSASLVGSEMCIRDSGGTPPARAANRCAPSWTAAPSPTSSTAGTRPPCTLRRAPATALGFAVLCRA